MLNIIRAIYLAKYFSLPVKLMSEILPTFDSILGPEDMSREDASLEQNVFSVIWDSAQE